MGHHRETLLAAATAELLSDPRRRKMRERCQLAQSGHQQRPNGAQADSSLLQPDQLAVGPGADNSSAAAATTSSAAAEKVNYQVVEWPRIYIALSRKEKEDDFLAMKGTKLPQRPKKKGPKMLIELCSIVFLSDLTRNRYEVRQKKCVKKYVL